MVLQIQVFGKSSSKVTVAGSILITGENKNGSLL